ncbi:DNA-binding response regulator [Sinomonas cellulolyticus]|nr:DNA-binding response regulator [Sinomonas sp. KCTC 49339]
MVPPPRKHTVRPMFGECKARRGTRPRPGVVRFNEGVEERSTGEARGLVLVVEDEVPIADLERLYLARAGYGVHVEHDGAQALARIRQLRPVAIVLDVGLPGLDGIEVCRRLREDGDWTPVIFVTARDDEVDRVLGLELGADDYLTKPFSPRELVARVRALLRRAAGPAAPAALSVGRVRLDLGRRSAEADGRPVSLTAMEFDLLAHLMSQPGRVFSREQLLATVWGQADYGGGRTVDVHVAQLRAKLGAASPIRTTRGIGYSASSEAAGPAPEPR